MFQYNSCTAETPSVFLDLGLLSVWKFKCTPLPGVPLTIY